MKKPTLKQRIIEKWEHAGFQKYFQNTGWMFFARIFGMAIAFFVTAIVARYLGPEKYGTLMYAVSFVGLFSFIASLGMDHIIYRELIKYPEKESDILGTSFILRMAGGFIAVFATIFLSSFFVHDLLEKKLILIISLSFIFQSFSILNYTFQSRLENKKLSYIIIIVNIILSLLKLLIVFSNKGVLFLSAILVIEPILYGLFLVFCYSRYFGKIRRWSFNKNMAKDIVKASLPLMFSAVFILIYSRIDQIIVKHYLNSTAVGLYSAAVTLSEVWYFIPSIIASTLFPSIINARKSDEAIYKKRVIHLTILLVGISSFIAFFGTIFAKLILHIIFGLNFVDAYRVLQFYIWSGVGISIGTVLIQYLITEKLSSIILYTSIIGMVINIALNLLLIPHYGINGSALATLISYTLGPVSALCFPSSREKILKLFRQ